VRQSHSKRRPWFDLNFPFLSNYAFLTAAAVTDPADGLPAAFLRPRCWTPDGRARRGKAIDDGGNVLVDFLRFVLSYVYTGTT
jgi:hypothetical protein